MTAPQAFVSADEYNQLKREHQKLEAEHNQLHRASRELQAKSYEEGRDDALRDGAYVGRCDHSTYDQRCPLHGYVGRFLGIDADLMEADDRLLLPREQRDFGSRGLRKYLGVSS